MIQHDMMLFDHGMPRARRHDEQGAAARSRRQHRVPGRTRRWPPRRQKLAWIFEAANEKYATDYPAAVGRHMTNTDSGPFMDIIPAISVRENERGVQIGNGWDPQWHQPTDVYATYNDKDFPPRSQRRADDAGRDRAAYWRSFTEEVGAAVCAVAATTACRG